MADIDTKQDKLKSKVSQKLMDISFEVGIGDGKTYKHFLSPDVIKQILAIPEITLSEKTWR